MKRFQLKNKYNRNGNHENLYLHKKQRNFCVTLLRKTKRNYFKSVQMEDIPDDNKFSKTIRPYISDMGYNQSCRKRFYYNRPKKICNFNE